MKKKKLYFFRPNLKNHFYLYYSWVSAAKEKGIDITMFTVMSRKQLKRQIVEYNEVKKLSEVKVIITPHNVFNFFYTILFIFYNLLEFDKVSLIAKKIDVKPLVFLRFFFKKRFKYYLEIEGDMLSEYNYLRKHPYKDGFYDKYLENEKKNIDALPKKIKKSDGVLVLSSELKKEMIKRYSFLTNQKIQVISTGFEKGRIYNDKKKRDDLRRDLSIKNSIVFIYAGNVHYSWQNMKITLKFFKFYLERFEIDSKFIILTREVDFLIVNDFLNDLKIPREKIILKEIPNSEVVNYYNAADICILLRSDDVMNKFASPGKIGEYAASGTPILTSSYIGDYSDLFKSQKMVSQISDIYNFELMGKEVNRLLSFSDEDKIEFSVWSNEILSSKNNVNRFIKAFEM